MTSLVLRYLNDPETNLPSLHPEGVRVPPDVLSLWEGELKERYAQLQRGKQRQFRFQTEIPGYPSLFDVEIKRGPHNFRQLILRPDPRALTEQLAPVDWTVGFLHEMRAFAGAIDAGGDVGYVLRQVVDEVERLALERPNELALLLVNGFVHLRDAEAVRSGDLVRRCIYVAAAQILSEAVVFDPSSPEAPPSPPAVRRGPGDELDISRVTNGVGQFFHAMFPRRK